MAARKSKRPACAPSTILAAQTRASRPNGVVASAACKICCTKFGIFIFCNFWVFAFCFFWTLWNDLFADFDTQKLLRSLGALFGLAFVVKYLILANLSAPISESWLQGIFQNPTKEAMTWLLDLPRFSGGTGYIQFFTVIFYLLGLFLLPNSFKTKD